MRRSVIVCLIRRLKRHSLIVTRTSYRTAPIFMQLIYVRHLPTDVRFFPLDFIQPTNS